MFDFADGYDADKDVANTLRKLNRTLAFCADSVRYDLQRNMIEVIEDMVARKPVNALLFQSFREVAETMIEGFEGRGRVHVGLRRLAEAEKRGAVVQAPEKVTFLGSLSEIFTQNARTDKYLVDRMLARRNSDGEVRLSRWGHFVLDYMDDLILRGQPANVVPMHRRAGGEDWTP